MIEDINTEEGIKQRDEARELLEEKESEVEVLGDGVIKKDPNFFYFINTDGKVCRKPRTSNKKKASKKTMINYFDKLDLSVPRILLSGWVSKKFKTVRRTGPNGGYIWVPPTLIGKTFQVILIPKEDWILSQISRD